MMQILALGAGVFVPLELSARIYLFGWAGLAPSRINSVHGLLQTGYVQPSPAARLGFEFKPNVDGYFKLVPFRTNSRGLRDREYEPRKPGNTFRVAVLGSSFALPAGVSIERAFHSLLEERLSGETRYEFINFAVGMYHPRQSVAMLELRALDYDPDLILFTLTRLATPPLVGLPPPQAPEGERAKLPALRKSYPILQSFLFRLLSQRSGSDPRIPRVHVGVIEGLFVAFVERWFPAAETWPSPGAGPARAGGHVSEDPADEAILERLAGIGRQTGIPIVVLRLEFEDTAPLPADLEVAARCRSLGLHYIDTRHAFRGTRASDYWIYELDPHPNWQAHEIFAREVASFLRSHGLVSAQLPR
jgi:hypothetical protein